MCQHGDRWRNGSCAYRPVVCSEITMEIGARGAVIDQKELMEPLWGAGVPAIGTMEGL